MFIQHEIDSLTIKPNIIINQEEINHFQSYLPSLTTIEQENIVRPELRVRRLSYDDWPYFNA